MASPKQFKFRRVDAAEFKALLDRADMTVSDFLYFSGRRRDQVGVFLGGRDTKERAIYIPTMGDMQLLHLAILYPDIKQAMERISDTYHLEGEDRT